MKLAKSDKLKRDAPPALDVDSYSSIIRDEFQSLLRNSSDDENVFQRFFERNPSYLPGAYQLFGKSGHYPYMSSLVSQPCIKGVSDRKPDFMWLARNSTDFSPIFIEIEKPSKRLFTGGGQQSFKYTQARNQILEWKVQLEKPSVRGLFLEMLGNPDELNRLAFKPQYCLIYGRRDEYEEDDHLRAMKSQLSSQDICLMPYDRLCPDKNAMNFVSVELVNKEFRVKHIPPTFRYCPADASVFTKYDGFKDRIPEMVHTSVERKEFLIERYNYWCQYASSPRRHIYTIHFE